MDEKKNIFLLSKTLTALTVRNVDECIKFSIDNVIIDPVNVELELEFKFL